MVGLAPHLAHHSVDVGIVIRNAWGDERPYHQEQDTFLGFFGMKTTGPRWTSAQSRVWTGFATVGVQARLFDKVNWFCSFVEMEGNFMAVFFASRKNSTYDIYKLTCLGKKRNFFSSIHLSPMFIVFSQRFYIFLFSSQFPATKRCEKNTTQGPKAEGPNEVWRLASLQGSDWRTYKRFVCCGKPKNNWDVTSNHGTHHGLSMGYWRYWDTLGYLSLSILSDLIDSLPWTSINQKPTILGLFTIGDHMTTFNQIPKNYLRNMFFFWGGGRDAE